MDLVRSTTTFLILVSAVISHAAPLSDSLFIEGHYSQNGRSIRRGSLENFLLDQNPSARLADQAKGLRLSAWVVGTPLWCINTGIAVYQIKVLMDAIEKQQMITGSSLSSFSLPLVIGSDITIFIQNILRGRSDYAIHRAVTAYNKKIQEKYFPDSILDHRIKKTNSGWYMQDRVLMPHSVLMPVLREKDASRGTAYWSSAAGFVGDQAISIGVMFLFFAAMQYIEDEKANIHERQVQLGIGIGVTSFGIINEIISAVTRNSAIKKYNGSMGDTPATVPHDSSKPSP